MQCQHTGEMSDAGLLYLDHKMASTLAINLKICFVKEVKNKTSNQIVGVKSPSVGYKVSWLAVHCR